MNLEDFMKDLSPELQEKAYACKSAEELLALAREEKVELPPEALEAIAGGNGGSPQNCGKAKCPKCGSKNTEITEEEPLGRPWFRVYYKCDNCGHEWNKKVWSP
jgi:hypothetical protein